MKHIFALCALNMIFIIAAPAMAAEPLAAPIRVSGGGTYDYVVIGESPMATDGYDNRYDTLSPGSNLNDISITAWFAHPEWQQVKSQFRGDIRSIAAKQEWLLSIVSTLPAGTPLTVALDNRLNILPNGLQLTVSDLANTTTASILAGGTFTFSALAPGTVTQLTITARQQGGASEPVTAGSYATDGDVDGDGQTTIFDALIVLNMAYGQIPVSEAGFAHGDMDGDAVLRLADALAVMRKSVGL